jgi:hypothetical protein
MAAKARQFQTSNGGRQTAHSPANLHHESPRYRRSAVTNGRRARRNFISISQITSHKEAGSTNLTTTTLNGFCYLTVCFPKQVHLFFFPRKPNPLGRAIAQAVSRRHPTAADRIRTQVTSSSPQSSSPSAEAGTIGQERPQCQ